MSQIYIYIYNMYTRFCLQTQKGERLSQRSNPMMKSMRELCANSAHLAPTCLNWKRAVVGGGWAQMATPPRGLM